MKGPMLLFTFQNILFEVWNFTPYNISTRSWKILVNVAVIPCDSNVSMEFMSSVVTSCLLMIETSLLGALTTFVYLRSVKEWLI